MECHKGLQFPLEERLKLFQNFDFEQVNKHGILKMGCKCCYYIGFAHLYLKRCDKESDEIDKEAYTKLVELDTRLGTPASKQLHQCLSYTTLWEIIKVCILFK